MTVEPWDTEDVAAELRRRVQHCLDVRELVVRYYRIGYTFSFDLPVAERPDSFPENVIGVAQYPWLIWLGWQLEERWRVLAEGSRRGGGDRARIEALLEREFRALGEWRSYAADKGGAGLVTAALASPIADVLFRAREHTRPVVDAATAVGERLIDECVLPWFVEQWQDIDQPGLSDLHNIRCITLLRGAQLASVLAHLRASTLQARAGDVFRAWAEARRSVGFTEGAAYDGYLLDSMTEWLAARPDNAELRDEASDVLADVPACWANLTLPGRPDLLAPLGDVEAEMTFWAGAAIRLCGWYPAAGADWMRRFPLARLPGNALPDAARLGRAPSGPAFATGRHEQPGTVTLRTGPGEPDDIAVAIGAAHVPMRHLHFDAGHLVLGWHGRFWITDPGYQQYRPGTEREYTLGPDAHNVPVIDGIAQSVRAASVEPSVGGLGFGLDLSTCYEGLPDGATVRRDVWLVEDHGAVVVRDRFAGLPVGTELATHWLGGADLAWSFVDGFARLGDGERALWFGTDDGSDDGGDDSAGLNAGMLWRHPASKGPIHLRHVVHTDQNPTERWWLFGTDPDATWTPPALLVDSEPLNLYGCDVG